METPIGTAFITVNDNGGGEPFEVFVQVARRDRTRWRWRRPSARLVSSLLRLPSPLSPRQRLEAAISQLSFIGGGQPTGFGRPRCFRSPTRSRARSPSTSARRARPGARHVPAPAGGLRRVGDLCRECGQATLVYEEGCKKCLFLRVQRVLGGGRVLRR